MSSESRWDSPATPPADGSETAIEGECGVVVTGTGTAADPYSLTLDLPDIIGAQDPGDSANGLVVLPAGPIEPGTCRHIEVSPAPAGGIEIDGSEQVALKAQLFTDEACVDKVSDAAASTVTTEQPFFVNRRGVTLALVSAFFVQAGTNAGNDTNNFAIIVRKRDAAGAATVLVTYTNNVASGGMPTAFVPKDLGALASATLAHGESLTFEIAKNGSGQSIGRCSLCVAFTVPG